ncbi:MAG TPA: adenylate/guanylate cyclase domain-containing protein [Candidatus Binatia bacterium]|nr:adenylate/guanylate cyclase domain-containing protein [Candidatus Binatia bacterium]
MLFVDIAGYTRLSERLSSARVTHLVERYFGAFLDEILARGGDVNETAGDGLMVIFQDEDPAGHARAAVLTGQAILAHTGVINAELAETREAIHLHLGVNSGSVALGAVRIEGLAGARWTYTASGPVTNVAARLAALSDDSVLLGAETAGRLAGTVRLQDLGPVALRNVGEPVRVFRLAGELDRLCS